MKCFGERPACTRCVRKDEICIYDAAEGVSRQQDLRTRLHSVETELGQTRSFIHNLQHSSNGDAAVLLIRLRLGEDVAELVNTGERRSARYYCFNLSAYVSDFPRRAPPPYYTNGNDLPTQPMAVESQQAQAQQSYTPFYDHLNHPLQDLDLLSFTMHQPTSFVTDHVSQLHALRSTNTTMRPASEYCLSPETDQNAWNT